MRRFWTGLLTLALLTPALAVVAEHSADYRDDFGDGGYHGSDGSLDWTSTPWTEDGTDDGSSVSGAIHLGQENCSNNDCLHMESGLLETLQVRRAADLSDLGTARLTFDLFVDPPLLPLTETLRAQVRGNGSGWRTVGTYVLGLSGGEHEESFDITEYAGSDFELRFRLTGLLDGGVTIDRVVLEGSVAAPTTTSSSSTSTSTTTTTRTSSPSSSSTTSTSAPTSSSSSSSSTSSTSSTTSTSLASSGGTDPTTTTTVPSASTTRPGADTSSTSVASADREVEATTTTLGESLQTREDEAGFFVASGSPPPPPSTGGLRDPGVGLISDFNAGMMGDMDMSQVDVLGAEVTADFSMAVEVFESAKVWIAVLALLLAAAIVGGVDRPSLGQRINR